MFNLWAQLLLVTWDHSKVENIEQHPSNLRNGLQLSTVRPACLSLHQLATSGNQPTLIRLQEGQFLLGSDYVSGLTRQRVGKRQHYDLYFTNAGQSQQEILKKPTTCHTYRKFMDEVAPNSDEKRQSVVLNFRVQKSLAVWLFRVEKWAGVRKYCMVFIQTKVKTDDIEVC